MEVRRKHQTAFTSLLSWKECIKEGLQTKEKELVRQYLQRVKMPQTSRDLSNALQKERTNITRSLYDLEKLGVVEVKHRGKCRVTGRLVNYYQLAE